MRYINVIAMVIIMLSMETPALAATPATLLDSIMASVGVPVSEVMAVLGLGLVGLSVIARR